MPEPRVTLKQEQKDTATAKWDARWVPTPGTTQAERTAAAFAQIMAKVGGPVGFSYPAEERSLRGDLIERVIVSCELVAPGVLYFTMVDTIQVADNIRGALCCSDPGHQHDPFRYRATYYRVFPSGRLLFAGQTALCAQASIWRKVIPELNRQMAAQEQVNL